MTEEEFWDASEYRVSHELRLMDNPQLQCLWCDGFIAEWHVDFQQVIAGK